MAAVALLWRDHGQLLNWDEVDYVNAASLGPVANAFETGSLSPAHFVRFALSKIAGKNPVLPPDYDESRDPFVLRHYHPPFVVFLLSAFSRSRSERVIRSVQLFGALAFTFATFLSYRSISGSIGWAGMLVVALMTLWLNRLLFGSVSFHGWAAVWATATAALLSRWLQVRKNAVGILLCVSLALALLTLETGLLVWAGAILCLSLWHVSNMRAGTPAFPWRHLVVGVSLVMLIVVVVWPGSVAKLSLLKNHALHAYRIWLGREYASVPAQMLFTSLLPALVLGPTACLWLFLAQRLDLRRWGTFVVVGGLYGIGMLPFAHRPEYLIPALAPLVCVVGVASDRVPGALSRVLVALLVPLAVISAWPSEPASAFERGTQEDLRWLARILRGREALVDGGHIYQYYLGPGYAIRPVTVTYDGDALLVREGGAYREIGPEDITGRVIVIQANRHHFFLRGAARGVLQTCPWIDRVTIRMYDCTRHLIPRS